MDSSNFHNINIYNNNLLFEIFSVPDREIVQYGIPHVTHFGNYGEYKVLIMTKTGPTLHKIRKSIKTKRFGMDVICKIAIQGVR